MSQYYPQQQQPGPSWPGQRQQQQPQYPSPQQPYYPPQQPQYPPQKPTAKRSPRTWLWIVIALFIGMVIGYGIHTPGTSPTSDTTTTTSQTTAQPTQPPTPTHPLPTPTPTHVPKWTTVQSFSGGGEKKTAIFTVPDDWKINWSCSNTGQNYGVDGVIYISVYGSNGSPVDLSAVSGTCTANKVVRDSTEEHQAGQVYLDINTGLPWTIQIQELK